MMKIYIILNENPEGSHTDVRYIFQNMKTDKRILDYKIYPFKDRLLKMPHENAVRQIETEVMEFEPDIILLSHTVDLKLTRANFVNFRKAGSKPVIAYVDGDIYHRIYKPLPREVYIAMHESDAVFYPGYNGANTFRNIKDKLYYLANCTDLQKFGGNANDEPLQYDITLIGNYVRSRIPFLIFPGARIRKRLAEMLYRELGEKFVVFGDGWNGEKYSKGPLDFAKQSEVYHKSRAALGVNNIKARYYFSNRLPICLSSGIPIIHNYEEGFEEVFRDFDYPYFFKDDEEALKKVRLICEKSREEIKEESLKYQKIILNRFAKETSFQYVISVMESLKHNEQVPENPWIDKLRFE